MKILSSGVVFTLDEGISTSHVCAQEKLFSDSDGFYLLSDSPFLSSFGMLTLLLLLRAPSVLHQRTVNRHFNSFHGRFFLLFLIFFLLCVYVMLLR